MVLVDLVCGGTASFCYKGIFLPVSRECLLWPSLSSQFFVSV